MPSSFTDLGFSPGSLLFGTLTIICFLLTASAFIISRMEVAYWKNITRAYLWPSTLFFYIGLICSGYLWTVTSWPVWDAKYQHIYAVEGKVTEVSNTWTDSGGAVSSSPVVTLDSVDVPLIVKDSRIISMEGQDVRLVCEVEFVYQGSDIYSCRIG